MEEIKKILAYNKQFVEEKRYEQYSASKFPNKKLAIVTCMTHVLSSCSRQRSA